MVRRLLDQDTIVIAAGGGGPPVYDDPILGLEGVDAVVDKDRVSAVLARQLEAEVLMILTNVEAVYEGWGTAIRPADPADDGGAGGRDDRGRAPSMPAGCGPRSRRRPDSRARRRAAPSSRIWRRDRPPFGARPALRS